jgi:hypothetical protein
LTVSFPIFFEVLFLGILSAVSAFVFSIRRFVDMTVIGVERLNCCDHGGIVIDDISSAICSLRTCSLEPFGFEVAVA